MITVLKQELIKIKKKKKKEIPMFCSLPIRISRFFGLTIIEEFLFYPIRKQSQAIEKDFERDSTTRIPSTVPNTRL